MEENIGKYYIIFWSLQAIIPILSLETLRLDGGWHMTQLLAHILISWEIYHLASVLFIFHHPIAEFEMTSSLSTVISCSL